MEYKKLRKGKKLADGINGGGQGKLMNQKQRFRTNIVLQFDICMGVHMKSLKNNVLAMLRNKWGCFYGI